MRWTAFASSVSVSASAAVVRYVTAVPLEPASLFRLRVAERLDYDSVGSSHGDSVHCSRSSDTAPVRADRSGPESCAASFRVKAGKAGCDSVAVHSVGDSAVDGGQDDAVAVMMGVSARVRVGRSEVERGP